MTGIHVWTSDRAAGRLESGPSPAPSSHRQLSRKSLDSIITPHCVDSPHPADATINQVWAHPSRMSAISTSELFGPPVLPAVLPLPSYWIPQ
jgi:hypothetical protein